MVKYTAVFEGTFFKGTEGTLYIFTYSSACWY